MGFSTPLLINNDCFHEILENPELFTQEIQRLMNDGGRSRIGRADIKMAQHSSGFHLYAVKHNNLTPLDVYSPEFKELVESHPNIARDLEYHSIQ